METQTAAAYRLTYWAAVFAAVFAIGYDVGQLAEWMGLMGSGGGPENDSTWYGLVVLLVPSLFLGLSFVVMMSGLHFLAPVEKKLWSQTALVFAVMYATLICMNYFVQLTFVAPHLFHGKITESARPFLFNVFDSFTYSVDLLGYSFMSLSTFFAAFVFAGPALERTTRWFLLANGLIVPFLALQTFFHPLIWPASLWALTMPGSAVCIAVLCRRKLHDAAARPENRPSSGSPRPSLGTAAA